MCWVAEQIGEWIFLALEGNVSDSAPEMDEQWGTHWT